MTKEQSFYLFKIKTNIFWKKSVNKKKSKMRQTLNLNKSFAKSKFK